jgi:hypothetical protein
MHGSIHRRERRSWGVYCLMSTRWRHWRHNRMKKRERIPFYGGLQVSLRDVLHVDCDQQSNINKGTFLGIYVASSSCSTAVAIDGAVNRIDDNRMTGHAEVVIRTPNADSFIFILCMSIGKFPSKLRSV